MENKLGVWVVGDSLNDTGSFSGVTATGRFTNTPSLLWTEIVARYFGSSVAPAYIFDGNHFLHRGGSNYAQSGAFVQAENGLFDGHSWSISQQLNLLLSEISDRPANTLLLMDGGGPDILRAAIGVQSGQLDRKDARSHIDQAGYQAAHLVLKAVSASLQCVVWVSVADFGKIPALGSGIGSVASFARELSLTFNAAFHTVIRNPPPSLVIVDLLTLVDEWITHPAHYDLDNVTDPGIDQKYARSTPTGNSANANPSHHVISNAPYRYLFADAIHPSARGHELIAERVLRGINSSGMLKNRR
jgi:outer membrane lipase/esterase